MTTIIKRRTMLKGTAAAGAVAFAAGAGLLVPRAVLAAWPKAGFDAKTVEDAMNGTVGSAASDASDKIKIKAPDIAENGAVVPVSVTSGIDGTSTITVLAEKNPSPLSCSFDMGAGADGFVSTRIKMGKTGDVIAVVKADGKLYSARKSVKVTIGGCGG